MSEILKEYELLGKKDLPQYDGKGVWLRHKKTGMEVFHILNDDEENLFGFSFKTIPEDSSGVPHILEHSVLCGSRSFPLRDPFMVLSNQSVKTFLNAMTFPDKTVFPASSTVEEDYFNLMSVYADAVFFPLLKEESFFQEGWRYEFNRKGRLEIQGVVYNEMKGVYSSFNSVVSRLVTRTMFRKSPYCFCSGGVPKEIPKLSYEAFKSFHKRFYVPGNCRLFLYGNIPTEKQLDFLEQKVLSRFPAEDAAEKERWEKITNFESVPFPNNRIRLPGPGKKSLGETLCLTWYIGDITPQEKTNLSFLVQALLMHDGSPLREILIKSEIGDGISPVSGIDLDIKDVLFTIGIKGAGRNREKEFEKLVMDSLRKIWIEGFSQDNIESTFFAFDFDNREIYRTSGPYSLMLMERALQGWLYGAKPTDTMEFTPYISNLRQILSKDRNFLQGLIKKYFLDNNFRTLLTVYPDPAYGKKDEKKLKKSLRKKLRNISDGEKEKILTTQALIQKKQTEPEPSSLLALIPSVHPSSLKKDLMEAPMETEENQGILFFKFVQPVKGIVYLNIYIPIDSLTPEEYSLVSVYSLLLPKLGNSGLSWEKVQALNASCTGEISSNVNISSFPVGRTPGKIYEGRDWLTFSVSFLCGSETEALKRFEGMIFRPDFEDLQRLRSLYDNFLNSFTASLIPSAHRFAVMDSQKFLSRNSSVNEYLFGLTQYSNCGTLKKGSTETLAFKLSKLHEKILNLGITGYIVADSESMEGSMIHVREFLKKFKRLSDPPENGFVPFSKKTGIFDFVPLPAQVGYGAASIPGISRDDPLSPCQHVLSHILKNGELWKRIRGIGGAYGAYGYPVSTEALFSFYTYRDPNPVNSLKVFKDCLKFMCENPVSREELDKAISGTYSTLFQPLVPRDKADSAFNKFVSGITIEERETRFRQFLSCTPDTIVQISKILFANFDKANYTVIGDSRQKKLAMEEYKAIQILKTGL